MAEEKIIPTNGEVQPDEAAAPEGQPGAYGPGTPETALHDLANSADVDPFLLPNSTRAVYYFAFDHHIDQGIASRYVRGLIPCKVVRAPHYRLAWPYFYPPVGSALPTLERSGSSEVWGQLYEAKGCDFARMEQHLNAPNRYHRRVLNVLDRGDRRFTAFTYVLSLFDERPSLPSALYMRELLDAARERKLPDEWLAYLEAMPTSG